LFHVNQDLLFGTVRIALLRRGLMAMRSAVRHRKEHHSNNHYSVSTVGASQ
jgi:hypothetical protein